MKTVVIHLKVLLFALFLFLSGIASAEIYHSAHIKITEPSDWIRLQSLGLALEEGVERTGDGLNMILNDHELRQIRKTGITAEVIQPDMESYFRSRLQAAAVDDFANGSMGGFYTYAEVQNKLKEYRRQYPEIISAPLTIGTSIEGRAIIAVKISDNADTEETDEPEALYTALHHAREPQSLMCLLYFMETILKKYGKDPEITNVIDNRQLWFVPVINPDGYVYNESTNPAGGGLWRKNRRRNPDGSYGVDLNRNYGYQWGIDDQGSSPLTMDDNFRGTGPFSEPETIAIRDFVKQRRFAVALNYHSYSNLLLFPWSYVDDRTPDHRIFRDFAKTLTSGNQYPFGNNKELLNYFSNGEADDWFYGDTSEKPAVFALTPEIGDFTDSFWPAPDRILPLAKEQFSMNLALASFPGSYPIIHRFADSEIEGDGDNYLEPGEKWRLTAVLRNLGFQSTDTELTVRLKSKSQFIAVESDSADYRLLRPFKKARGSFTVAAASNAPTARLHKLLLFIYSENRLLRKETVHIFVNPPVDP